MEASNFLSPERIWMSLSAGIDTLAKCHAAYIESFIELYYVVHTKFHSLCRECPCWGDSYCHTLRLNRDAVGLKMLEKIICYIVGQVESNHPKHHVPLRERLVLGYSHAYDTAKCQEGRNPETCSISSISGNNHTIGHNESAYEETPELDATNNFVHKKCFKLLIVKYSPTAPTREADSSQFSATHQGDLMQ